MPNTSNNKEHLLKNWETVKDMVRKEYELSDISYVTWVKPLIFHGLDEDSSLVTILIPSDQYHMRKYITSKYTDYFRVTIGEFLGASYDVSFILDNDVPITELPKPRNYIHGMNFENTNLNTKYTFDTFVVGGNNRLAHSAALAVAENPGAEYNPLYVYCGAGLGKTHLMHAIGHYVLKHNPEKKVLYVNSEHFTNEVIGAIRSGNNARMTKIREKYRTVDVLLLDDVQFIIGKESTQEEFFHTFNVLHTAGKQIILTSDKPPKDMETLEERLRSRFGWGLIADMQPPDYETRMAILQKYVEPQSRKIDNKILEYIAANITSNVRELESGVNKVLAYSKLEKQELNMSDIEYVLKDIIHNEKRPVTPKLILNVVAEQYGINAADILSKKKNAELIEPRHVIMHLCRKLTDWSYNQIGALLSRDHTTVIHGDKKITGDILTNDELRAKVEAIGKLLSP